MLMDDSISNEERQKYLIDEYHEYERERYYERKIVKINEDEIDYSPSPEEQCIKNQEEKEFFSFLNLLNTRQKELIKLIYFENKTQEQVAKQFNVSKSAINQSLKRIYKKIKKFQKNH